MLKYTQNEIELFTNKDMYLTVQKGMRGGRCEVAVKYAEANNKYINNNFNKKLGTYLQSLDANSLYGGAMTFKLPHKNHRWILDLSIFTDDFIKSYDINCDYCYILEVEIECPDNIHDTLFDYPGLCERKKPPNEKVEKLLSTFDEKNNYVAHIYICYNMHYH